MSDDPKTDVYSEAEIAEYLPGSIEPQVIQSLDDLELLFAHAVFGGRLDEDTPIGMEVLNTVGRQQVAPYVEALLSAPRLQVTFLPEPGGEEGVEA
jgi:hypothetical protein